MDKFHRYSPVLKGYTKELEPGPMATGNRSVTVTDAKWKMRTASGERNTLYSDYVDINNNPLHLKWVHLSMYKWWFSKIDVLKQQVLPSSQNYP